MACLLTSGISLSCRNSNGGLQTVYIGNYNGSSLTYTLGTGASGSYITAFTGGTSSYYQFAQPNETSAWTSEGAFSAENGTSFYTQKVELTIQQMNSTNNVNVNILGQGSWRIVVLDQNGIYFLIGAQNGARVVSSTPGAGKAMGDLNGAVVTFEAKEPVTAYELSTSAALQLIS